MSDWHGGPFSLGLRNIFDRWRHRAHQVEREAHAVYLACKDPRVPWYAKALAACVLAYLLSPIDLIPDFIPVVGYLDDLFIVPAGLLLVIGLIPREVMTEHREMARMAALERKPNWIAASMIVGIWIYLLVWVGRLVYRYFVNSR